MLLRGILHASSVLAVNVAYIVDHADGLGDLALLDDTRRSLAQLVKFARQAQRFKPGG